MKNVVNQQGGIDSTDPKEQKRAKNVDLITLPLGITGTNCGNCQFFKAIQGSSRGNCAHPEIMLPVTSRMCCGKWDKPGTRRGF